MRLETSDMDDANKRDRRAVPTGSGSRTGVDIHAARCGARDAVKDMREGLVDWIGRPYKN